MTVIEEVLTDPELSAPVTLHHYGGAVTETRGVYRKLPESPAHLMGSFSKSGPNVWVPTPENAAPVERVTVNGSKWRAFDAEQVGSLAAWVGTSTRYQLVHPVDQ